MVGWLLSYNGWAAPRVDHDLDHLVPRTDHDLDNLVPPRDHDLDNLVPRTDHDLDHFSYRLRSRSSSSSYIS